MPLSDEAIEQAIADVMAKMRDDAVVATAERFNGVNPVQFILSLPYMLRATLEAITGYQGEALADRFDKEAWEVGPNKSYRHMTIPHAIYRVLDDAIIIAQASALNAAREELGLGGYYVKEGQDDSENGSRAGGEAHQGEDFNRAREDGRVSEPSDAEEGTGREDRGDEG